MKKTLLYSMATFIMIALVSLSSCKKDDPEPTPVATPVANFTYSIAGDFAPTVVTYTNTSTNSTSYSWDFGDGGSTSTETSPSHTYSSGGVYTVILTSTGAGGTVNVSKTINIGNPPTKVQINQLKLIDYPQANTSGSGWDYTDGPDIYWIITNEAMTTTYFTGGTINDAIYSNLPFTYTNGLPVTFTSLTQKYVIAFYDADSPDDDDYMGGYYFTPSEWTSYPSILSFYSSTSDFEFELSAVWSNSSKSFQTNNTKTRIELIPVIR